MTEEQIKPANFNFKKFLIYIVIIIGIILTIYFISNMGSGYTPEPETAICIAMHSELYTSKTCSNCQKQIDILSFKGYDSLFSITDCILNSEICLNKSIIKVPTWIIDNKTYSGVKSWEELKGLTKCNSTKERAGEI